MKIARNRKELNYFMGKQVPFAILAETSDAKYRSWAMAMDFVLWYIYFKNKKD